MDVKLERLAKELTLLGMSLTSSKIYIMLLLLGGATVREIVERLGLDRVKTYKEIKCLRNLGLVEAVLGNPTFFRPVDPSKALYILIKRKELELQTIKDLADDLLPRLKGLTHTGRVGGYADGYKKEYIKLIGGLSIFDKMREDLKAASEQVIEVVGGPALPLHYKELFDYEVDCADRGVEVKMITELNKANAEIVYKYLNHIEVRHLDHVTNMLRYMIIDRKKAFIRLNEPPLNYSSDFTTLWTSKHILVQALCNEFESLWAISKDVNEVFKIKRIKLK